MEHAFRAAIRLRARLETARHQPIERGDRAAVPAQLVVEREHLRDQRRPHLERRLVARGGGLPRGAPEEHLSLESGEERRRVRQTRVETRVQLVARDQIRQHERARRGGRAVEQRALFERPPQFLGGRARWDDDGRAARRDHAGAHTAGNRALERLKVRDPQQAGRARSDHFGSGALEKRSISSDAR